MEPRRWTRQDQADAVRLDAALKARKASERLQGSERIESGRLSGGFKNSTQPAADAGERTDTKDRADAPRVSGIAPSRMALGRERICPRSPLPAIRPAMGCNDNAHAGTLNSRYAFFPKTRMPG